MLSQSTLGYFCAPPGHYWQWEQDVDGLSFSAAHPLAMVWADDRSTALLVPELLPMLEGLATEGLPPLGAVLLVLSAASDQWDPERFKGRLAKAVNEASGKEMSLEMSARWRRVAHGLNAVHSLPSDLRTGSLARLSLLKILFEGAFNRLPADVSASVLAEFKELPSIEPLGARAPDLNGIARILRDLSVLDKSLRGHAAESLEQRLRAGVEITAMPEAAAELSPADTAGVEEDVDLLAELEKLGGELSQIAGVARRLSAILHVPKPLAQREDLALGGVSDITNRGDPASLLLTELAWDDLTFSVRLSQGEALYMRRESPPSEPPPQRTLVLDCGIFMWGKPRLFALGAALALLRDKDAQSQIFVRLDGAFLRIDLKTIADVREHLMRLDACPDPWSALGGFETAVGDSWTRDGRQEVFVIGHPVTFDSVANQPEWLGLTNRVALHSVTVDKNGDLLLNRHTAAGSRVLTKVHVELETVVKEPQVLRSLTNERKRLPAFYLQNVWPLYHTVVPAEKSILCLGERSGYVGISASGCVCVWDGKHTVSRVLASEPPAQELLGVAMDFENDARAVLIFQDSRGGDFVGLFTSLSGAFPRRLLPLTNPQRVSLTGTSMQSGALILHGNSQSSAYSLSDGSLLAQKESARNGLWFDGEQFHPGTNNTMPNQGLKKAFVPVELTVYKRRRISMLAAVGFNAAHQLVVQKEQGRTYVLETTANAGKLKWVSRPVDGVAFRSLHSMELPGWGDKHLSQAEFSDGRRVVYDPHGILHIVDPARSGAELSVLTLEADTAAWSHTGAFYGNPNLFWDEPQGNGAALNALTQVLFRPATTILLPAPKVGIA